LSPEGGRLEVESRGGGRKVEDERVSANRWERRVSKIGVGRRKKPETRVTVPGTNVRGSSKPKKSSIVGRKREGTPGLRECIKGGKRKIGAFQVVLCAESD